MTAILRGYDFDGVTTVGIPFVQPCVIISGRTFAEYDEHIKHYASIVPVYIRGVGNFGDSIHAGEHKAAMINLLGVGEFFEDDPKQIEIIRKNCPKCTVFWVKSASETIKQQ